jgi:hypothetical protein
LWLGGFLIDEELADALEVRMMPENDAVERDNTPPGDEKRPEGRG